LSAGNNFYRMLRNVFKKTVHSGVSTNGKYGLDYMSVICIQYEDNLHIFMYKSHICI